MNYTKAGDYVFVYDNIHHAFKVHKAKVWVTFAKCIGWEITKSAINGHDMQIEYHGVLDGEEELMPDYGSDLESLREWIDKGRLIIGPEFAWFQEKDHSPMGYVVYRTWQDIALDYIDRLGSAKALAISQDLNVAIMLAYMIKARHPFDVEDMA